ncbi:MAG: 8-amino-7-oxononanoate synthase [Candidatus Omnitrophica bacterium]|nr:8-amino-7-oxononanoate synthase [Candidatus Omnitrophota bacterium]
MNNIQFWDQELEEIKKKSGFRFLRTRDLAQSGKFTHAMLDGREVILFGGNDYLGLSHHPQVMQAAIDSIREFGVGSGAAQLIHGHTSDHALLEKRLAEFKDAEAVLIFPSGYQSNLAAVSTLVGKGDLVVMDKLNHASLIDACRLSGAEFRVFPHKNYERLEEILAASLTAEKKLIVTDSVFSMDGDLADLETLVHLKEKYGAMLMVDEAHAIGVFGKKGSGLVEEKGLWNQVDIQAGTLSKAIGVQGGFIAGSRKLIDYLVNFSRPFIFSTAIAPHLCRAAKMAVDLIESEKKLREKLLWKTYAVKEELVKDLGFNVGPTQSPIIPIMIGEVERALRISKALLDEGIFIPAIRPPAVALGESRLRLVISAAHDDDDVRKLLLALQKVKKYENRD